MNKLKQLLSILPEPLRDYYLNHKYNKQLRKWEAEGRPLPTPHIVKQLVIKSYKNKYNADTLVETGTYLGDMVYSQRKLFSKIYTIELSTSLHKKASERLRKYKNIELIQGDSGTVLGSIMNNIDDKAIFWLDGHYSGGITAKGAKECPVLQELATILKSPHEHIILIDDAREFDGQNDYPSVETIVAMLQKSTFPTSAITIEDDIIRIELKA